MPVDPRKTLSLLKGGLLTPKETWSQYRDEDRPWVETAALLTVPMVVLAAVLAAVLGGLFGSASWVGYRSSGFGGWLAGLIFALAGLAVCASIISYFAGLFRGVSDFSRGLAAASLAAVPAYTGSILGTLPWVGGILALVLGVVSLVFLYQIIPVYLEVPEEKRVAHYLASLVAFLVAALLMGLVLGSLGLGAGSAGLPADRSDSAPPGPMGWMNRQAALYEAAEADRYEPPPDGRVAEEQMHRYVEAARKVARLRSEQAGELQRLESDLKDSKDPGLADIAKYSSGMQQVLGVLNAEMEVVKSGGGNWAEHQWVANQLRNARIHRDTDTAAAHNYALYQKYENQLREYGALP